MVHPGSSTFSRAGKPILRLALLATLFLTVLLADTFDAQRSASAQAALLDGIDLTALEQVIPRADSFAAKSGEPPVFKAFRNVAGASEPELLGYAFLTRDLPPEEIGYSAAIDMLVGMDLAGTITGMKVLNYRESFKSIRGDFLNTEGFPQQFTGKLISDGFRVGRDVDGVSRASISSWAVSRGIRNAARRVAETYLSDNEFIASLKSGSSALEYLRGLSWAQMQEIGYITSFDMELPDATRLELSLAFMGNDGLGSLLIGADDYSRAEREASNRTDTGQLLLVGVSGNASRPFRQELFAVQQGEQLFDLPRRNFVYAGRGENGKMAGHVRFAGALVLDSAIDVTQPFTLLYYLNQEQPSTVEYSIPAAVMAQVQGQPWPPQDDLLASAFTTNGEEGSQWQRLFNSAPTSSVLLMVLILSLAMTAFLRKSSSLRWITLGLTLAYLGFWTGGFLSVSHITNAIILGPSVVMTDLPLFMLVIFTLVTTLLWGRVFCSSLCPFGALQDILTRLMPRHFHYTVPAWIHDRAIYIKYVVLALLLVMAVAASEISIFQYFEPFGTAFFFSPSIVLWIILIATLLASTVIKRFYCRYACPLGAALGVMSLVSPLRIKRVAQCKMCKVCEHACPTGAIRGPTIDFKECVRCDVCEIKLIARSGVCKHPVEEVTVRIKHWEPLSV